MLLLPGPWTSLQQPAELAGTSPQSKEAQTVIDLYKPANYFALNSNAEKRCETKILFQDRKFGFISLRRTKVKLFKSSQRGGKCVETLQLLLWCTNISFVSCTTNNPRRSYLSLSENDVSVWSWAFVDVWFGDDKENVLRLANGYPGNSGHLSETQFGHRLKNTSQMKSLALDNKTNEQLRGMHHSPFSLSFHFCFVWLYWPAPRQFQQQLQAV